ncbi:MAG: aminopeptidase [Candidatus Aenigmarchaeota archaeon]|nr:aminopeptidase [Candidatus Aenigmarchaeota archaeon]
MADERIRKVADILVNYSTKVKKGDRVLINFDWQARELALECYKLCIINGALPKLDANVPGQAYIYYKHAAEHQLKSFPKVSFYEVKNTEVCMFIGADENTRELTNIDPSKISMRRKITRPISDWRVNKTRWIIFDFPTNSLAQEADMSLEEFEDFVFRSAIKDWKREARKMEGIKKALDATNIVRIIGEETDIRMSVKGRNGVVGDGSNNMPDGEVFTAPLERTVEGKIFFSFPAIYGGREVEGVRLEFKKGKVIKATATKNQDYLKKMIAMDAGSSYLGELGLGCNYTITKFVKNILFDEKIGGTIHMALGSAYKECKGTNESALHWDMIKDLRKGGEIWFDKRLVQKDGKWLI